MFQRKIHCTPIFSLLHILFAAVLLNISHCADNIIPAFERAGQYENGEAYQPNLDIFIFRGSDGFPLPNGETNAANYVSQLFANDVNSVHEFQIQNAMAFYNSVINIYYVKSTSLANTYFADGLNGVTNLTLTDETGSQNKGIVTIDYNQVVIFFAKVIHLDSSVSGFSTIGDGLTINNSSFRIQYRIAIGGNYFQSIDILRHTVSHELGHYFGLEHSFDTNSCLQAPKGTTARIMDYVTNSDTFITCEQNIAKAVASVYLQKTPYSVLIKEKGLLQTSIQFKLVNSSSKKTKSKINNYNIYNGNWFGKKNIQRSVANLLTIEQSLSLKQLKSAH